MRVAIFAAIVALVISGCTAQEIIDPKPDYRNYDSTGVSAAHTCVKLLPSPCSCPLILSGGLQCVIRGREKAVTRARGQKDVICGTSLNPCGGARICKRFDASRCGEGVCVTAV